jgi:hypothetical protein
MLIDRGTLVDCGTLSEKLAGCRQADGLGETLGIRHGRLPTFYDTTDRSNIDVVQQ